MRPSSLLLALEAAALALALPPAAPAKPGVLGKLAGKIHDFFAARPPAARVCPAAAAPGSAAADGPGFQRFEWVVDGRLARSSAPHYRCHDSDQRLTPASVALLQRLGIRHVISLNAEARSRPIREALTRAGIDYTPLPVDDFRAPTLKDFMAAFAAFRAHRRGGTLVWCGYGHGRTGTMVSALLMYLEHQKPSPRRLLISDYWANHVETAAQAQALDRLQFELIRIQNEKGKMKKVSGPAAV